MLLDLENTRYSQRKGGYHQGECQVGFYEPVSDELQVKHGQSQSMLLVERLQWLACNFLGTFNGVAALNL